MDVALITFSGWRVGSSMITGLLEKMGANLGTYKKHSSQLNPLGFFENSLLLSFQKKCFGKHWCMFEHPLATDEMKKLSN